MLYSGVSPAKRLPERRSIQSLSVIWRGTRLLAALAAVALLAGALSACGGSGSGASSSTSATVGSPEKGGGQKEETSPEKSRAGGREGAPGGSNGDGQAPRSAPVSPLQVSGGGSGQFRVKGGDNSIQEFGEESAESELEEAATALHAYLASRAEEDWKAACARLSKTVIAQLRLLGEHSKSGQRACPAVLAAITPPLPIPVQRESTVVDAGSLRVEGDRGFLIYRGAEETVYAINMAREDGWKVGALAGVPLS